MMRIEETFAAEDRIDEDPGGKEKRAKGKALKRSKAQLAALASVSEADIKAARGDWKRKTLPEYKLLIEAERED